MSYEAAVQACRRRGARRLCVGDDRLCAGRGGPAEGPGRNLSRSAGAAGRLAPLPRRAGQDCAIGQNRAAQAAGVPTGKIYAHTDGDSWDYLAIDPVTTEAQDAAADAAAKKAGMPVGPASSIEFRKYVSVHTDTFVVGPMTPAQYLAMVGQ